MLSGGPRKQEGYLTVSKLAGPLGPSLSHPPSARLEQGTSTVCVRGRKNKPQRYRYSWYSASGALRGCCCARARSRCACPARRSSSRAGGGQPRTCPCRPLALARAPAATSRLRARGGGVGVSWRGNALARVVGMGAHSRKAHPPACPRCPWRRGRRPGSGAAQAQAAGHQRPVGTQARSGRSARRRATAPSPPRRARYPC